MRLIEKFREFLGSLNHIGAFSSESGMAESSQAENQAGNSETVPPSEQTPTSREEKLLADPEGAIRYGKTRAA